MEQEGMTMMCDSRSMKVVLRLAIAGLTVLSITAVQPAQAAERVIRFANHFSLDNPINKAALAFADVVREKTNGRIEIRIVPNASLGSERQVMEGLQFGSIEMGFVAANVVQGVEPAAGALSLPYIVRDFDHAFKVEDSALAKEIEAKILKTMGVRVLAYNPTGFREVATRSRAVKSIADLRNLKIRVPESRLLVDTFRALGAAPTPLPWGDIYMGVQSGLIDGAESPPGTMDDAKLFEVINIVTLTNHVFTDGYILINEKLWQSLSEQDKAAMLEGAKADQDLERSLTVEQQAVTIESLKKRGITVNAIDTKPLQEAVLPVYQEYAKSIGGMDLINRIIEVK
jgi:TRAP-type transport system periplasmic protein